MRPNRPRNLFRRAPGLPGWAALATSGKAATPPRLLRAIHRGDSSLPCGLSGSPIES